MAPRLAATYWHFVDGVWVVVLGASLHLLEFSDQLQELLKQRKILRSHVSLTDERDMAAATVILEGAD